MISNQDYIRFSFFSWCALYCKCKYALSLLKCNCLFQRSGWRHGTLRCAPEVFKRTFDSKVMRLEPYLSLLSFCLNLFKAKSTVVECHTSVQCKYCTQIPDRGLALSRAWSYRNVAQVKMCRHVKIGKYWFQGIVFLVFSTCTIFLWPRIFVALSCKLYWLL